MAYSTREEDVYSYSTSPRWTYVFLSLVTSLPPVRLLTLVRRIHMALRLIHSDKLVKL